MDTNGHEWAGGNHEKHENTRGGEVEPRMDTNGQGGTTNGHRWARMDIISCNNFMFFQMIWNQTCWDYGVRLVGTPFGKQRSRYRITPEQRGD